jgi:hypothetical protein
VDRSRAARWRGWVWPVLIGVWCASTVTGIALLQRYKSTPAATSAPPMTWPAASHIERDASKLTLVLFAHPYCPCTRATMHELRALLDRVGDAVRVHVLFSVEEAELADAKDAELWKTAAAIPGVEVSADVGGAEARLFRATNSGHVLLFDGRGAQLFFGGITGARGHEGDNPGLSRLTAWIEEGHAELDQAPVFGCELMGVARGEP